MLGLRDLLSHLTLHLQNSSLNTDSLFTITKRARVSFVYLRRKTHGGEKLMGHFGKMHGKRKTNETPAIHNPPLVVIYIALADQSEATDLLFVLAQV